MVGLHGRARAEPRPGGGDRTASQAVSFSHHAEVEDYAIDAGKVTQKLGYSPHESFETGLTRTLDWYLDNEAWWRPLTV